MNDLLCSENISRRDFFKLKFLMMFYMFFSNFLGVNIFDESKKQKLDYSILDKFLELPFSKEVKNEITLRVNLQKKYSFDSRGYLQPLDRVLQEIIDFIIYSKNIKDFKLLCSIQDSQIDYTYSFNRSARRGAIKQMKHIQNKLISTNNTMLNDALIYAFKSKSVKSVLHLLQSKIQIEESTQLELVNLFKNDEYVMFQKELLKNQDMKLLPVVSIKENLNKRKMSKKQIGFGTGDVAIPKKWTTFKRTFLELDYTVSKIELGLNHLVLHVVCDDCNHTSTHKRGL